MAKIVIAEDDRSTRILERKIAHQLGHHVTLCVNGRTAWELLDANEDFELLILDIEMPEMDGMSLLAKIREDERFDDMEVLVVSGRCNLEEANLLLSSGADGFQPKPVKPESLKENIQLLLMREH